MPNQRLTFPPTQYYLLCIQIHIALLLKNILNAGLLLAIKRENPHHRHPRLDQKDRVTVLLSATADRM